MNHKCVICSSITHDESDKKGRIFHFCDSCGFISLDSSFFLSDEEERKRYDLHNNSSDNSGYVQWLRTFMEKAVLPYISHTDRILDFGCGPNPLLKDLMEEEGYSVDIYDKYFHDIPFSGTYDMVTSTEVIEHLKNPVGQLKALGERLNPDGYIAIKTAFRPAEEADFLKWWYKEDSTHISFFSSKTFEFVSQKIGLSVYYCDDTTIVIFRN